MKNNLSDTLKSLKSGLETVKRTGIDNHDFPELRFNFPLSIADRDTLLIEAKKMALREVSRSEDAKLIEWLYEVSKRLYSPSEFPISQTHVFFSPGNECRKSIINLLDQAQNQIEICVFTISDNEITESILRAFESNVSVRIITDNDKAYDKGSDVFRLLENGVNLAFDPTRAHMHHKFAIIDNAVLTGSYNWTRSAAEYNNENIIVSTDSTLRSEFKREFEKLWIDFTKWST